MIDPVLMGGDDGASVGDMLRCIHIGLLCVQEKGEQRPTMASAQVMLSSVSVTLPLPSKPAYFSSVAKENQTELTKAYDTQNEASITDLYPR